VAYNPYEGLNLEPPEGGYELWRHKNADKMATKGWSGLYWARPTSGGDYEIRTLRREGEAYSYPAGDFPGRRSSASTRGWALPIRNQRSRHGGGAPKSVYRPSEDAPPRSAPARGPVPSNCRTMPRTRFLSRSRRRAIALVVSSLRASTILRSRTASAYPSTR
jgi:hypothetical protein